MTGNTFYKEKPWPAGSQHTLKGSVMHHNQVAFSSECRVGFTLEVSSCETALSVGAGQIAVGHPSRYRKTHRPREQICGHSGKERVGYTERGALKHMHYHM